jgi:hypothetical protein
MACDGPGNPILKTMQQKYLGPISPGWNSPVLRPKNFFWHFSSPLCIIPSFAGHS